jgi:hypothetical protein
VQVHPLVSEARFQRKALAELLSRLGLPTTQTPMTHRHAAVRLAAPGRRVDGNEATDAPAMEHPTQRQHTRGPSGSSPERTPVV